MQLVALQRDQCLRDAYVRDVSLYQSNFMVFIDETGCDRRDIHRKYGYGLRKPPLKQVALSVNITARSSTKCISAVLVQVYGQSESLDQIHDTAF